jgi:hypothetical protein
MLQKLMMAGAVCVVAGAMAISSRADDKPATTQPAFDEAAAMQAWMEAATPGKEHADMVKMVGDWSVDVDDFTAGTKRTYKADSTFKLILGGRYLVQEYKSDFGGMVFEGIGTTAYDKVRKVYVDTWIDSMGTGVIYSEGTVNADGKLVMEGKMTMPDQGKASPFKSVSYEEGDKHIFEMHMDTPAGPNQLAMRFVYSRKK